MSGDLIERYLAELRARLRTPDAVLILAEAEDHLRETAAAGLAIGMSEREAQEAALSAFGSVRAVSHSRSAPPKFAFHRYDHLLEEKRRK